MTELVFQDDSYAQSCRATVIGADDGYVVLDRTVFYARGGGQPGDRGTLTTPDGATYRIQDTIKDRETGSVRHILAAGEAVPLVGAQVTALIDWQRRHRLMRMHSCLHLLSSLVNGAVTGGQVGEDKSRLDFDLPDTSLDKDTLTAGLNQLIEHDDPVNADWITDAELDADPALVKTMSVAPPRGSGKVRLIRINGVDLQACGGTHVSHTGEIGAVTVTKIENKGRHNRRIVVTLD